MDNSNENNKTEAAVETSSRVFELVVSFVPVQRAMLRIEASSEEMARRAVTEMAGDTVQSLNIEEVREVSPDEDSLEVADEMPGSETTPVTKH